MKNGNIYNNRKFKQIKPVSYFDNIKSNFIFKKIIDFVIKKKALDAMRYNKKLQKRLNLNINDYKEYSQLYSSIEIELKIIDKEYGTFINVPYKDVDYYHIYFDNSKNEIKRYSLNENEKVEKIKIIINHQVKSFENLFKYCYCINSIIFNRFIRINIAKTSNMFYECSYLKELNLSNFKTDNVTDMSGMFLKCSSLKELNLSNFNTINVTNMKSMFYKCSSLEKLNISNFNTNKVINMSEMFHECSSLKDLNLSNFNTINVTNMHSMFYECISLKELNLSNFNTDKVIDMGYMFLGCSSLIELNLSNFNFNVVEEMSGIFKYCFSLKKLNTNFSFNYIDYENDMFIGCPPELIKKIKSKKYA